MVMSSVTSVCESVSVCLVRALTVKALGYKLQFWHEGTFSENLSRSYQGHQVKVKVTVRSYECT